MPTLSQPDVTDKDASSQNSSKHPKTS